MNVEQFFSERRYSKVEDEFPDKILYPLYYTAHKSEITIGPGEGVFIPAGWFHFVFSEGELNEAVNSWYISDVEEGTRNNDIPIKFRHEIKDLELDENTEVEVNISSSNLFGSSNIISKCKDSLKQQVLKTLKQFYEEKDPHTYVVQSRKFPHLDKYATDRKRQYRNNSVWINFGNVRTLLHYDLDDNYLHQVKGTKRILFFPPEDRDLLYLWNPYPLHILSELQVVYYDADYVHTFVNEVTLEQADRFIEHGINDEDNEELTRQYYTRINEYYEKTKLDVPINQGQPKFKVIKSSDLPKTQLFPQFAHFFIFLDQINFKQKFSVINVCAHASVMFPNTFTFKWWIDEGYIIVPTLTEEEGQ